MGTEPSHVKYPRVKEIWAARTPWVVRKPGRAVDVYLNPEVEEGDVDRWVHSV